MFGVWRKTAGRDVIASAEDAARDVRSLSPATVVTAIASMLALLFSGISLYQTVLKQADLHLFVPDTISYTRDPNGSFEVFVVPVTVANAGARDGIVSSLALNVKNLETGRTRTFHASYFAEPGYFSTKEDITKGLARPKRAFAPLTVAGRSGYSGTILFYPRAYDKERVVIGAGDFDLKLSAKMVTVDQMGVLDRFWSSAIAPMAFLAKLPSTSRFFQGRMLSGHNVRMFVQSKPNGN